MTELESDDVAGDGGHGADGGRDAARPGRGGGPEEREVRLTPEEERALAELPRRRAPSELLKRRIVSALRAEGRLRPGAEGPGTGGAAAWRTGARECRESGSRRFPPRARRWVGAAAAAAALFLGGILVGQSIGSRTTAEAMLAARRAEADVTATWIQQIGSAWVAALAALRDRGDTGEPFPVDAARSEAVARSILQAAVAELARLDPDDAELRMVLDLLREEPFDGSGRPGRVTRTVSF